MPNIIADIAGRYYEFLLLIKKMPDDNIISVGDMIDRGPKSKEVLEWFIKYGEAIMGNHEHLMLDELLYNNRFYIQGNWIINGGNATYKSFNYSVPKSVLTWIKKLPLYMEIDDFFISHSFVSPELTIDEACSVFDDVYFDDNIIWNRGEPARMKNKYQIAGHNSQFGLRSWRDENGEFAICIDDSKNRKLTGINIPSMKIYQQDYLG